MKQWNDLISFLQNEPHDENVVKKVVATSLFLFLGLAIVLSYTVAIAVFLFIAIPIWILWCLVRAFLDFFKGPSEKAFDIITYRFFVTKGTVTEWDEMSEQQKATEIVNLTLIIIATSFIWFLPWLVLFLMNCVDKIVSYLGKST